MQIRVFNYNTLERVHMFEAHSDYIRCIAVHPTQPFILTSSGKKEILLVMGISLSNSFSFSEMCNFLLLLQVEFNSQQFLKYLNPLRGYQCCLLVYFNEVSTLCRICIAIAPIPVKEDLKV